MYAYEKATSPPHRYLILDLKPIIHDDHRLRERDTDYCSLQLQLGGYLKKQLYRKPFILNAKYNMEQEIENILNARL